MGDVADEWWGGLPSTKREHDDEDIIFVGAEYGGGLTKSSQESPYSFREQANNRQ